MSRVVAHEAQSKLIVPDTEVPAGVPDQNTEKANHNINHPQPAKRVKAPKAKEVTDQYIKVAIPENYDTVLQTYVPRPQYGGDWYFLQVFYDVLVGVSEDWLPGRDGLTTEFRMLKLQQANTAVRQLDTLSRTVCQICGGFGHSKKMCPTLARIEVVGMSTLVARNLLAQAKHEVIVVGAAHMRGGAEPPKSLIPYKGTGTSRGGTRKTQGSGQALAFIPAPGDDMDDEVLTGRVLKDRVLDLLKSAGYSAAVTQAQTPAKVKRNRLDKRAESDLSEEGEDQNMASDQH